MQLFLAPFRFRFFIFFFHSFIHSFHFYLQQLAYWNKIACTIDGFSLCKTVRYVLSNSPVLSQFSHLKNSFTVYYFIVPSTDRHFCFNHDRAKKEEKEANNTSRLHCIGIFHMILMIC